MHCSLTLACFARSGTCYDVGGKHVFVCGLCSPLYKAGRDEKAAFAYAVKTLKV